MTHLRRSADYHYLYCGETAGEGVLTTMSASEASCPGCLTQCLRERRPEFVPVCITCGGALDVPTGARCRGCILLTSYA